MRRHQGARSDHFDVSNVIYHKFSHGAAFYMLNGKKVNAMLEFMIIRLMSSGAQFIISVHDQFAF